MPSSERSSWRPPASACASLPSVSCASAWLRSGAVPGRVAVAPVPSPPAVRPSGPPYPGRSHRTDRNRACSSGRSAHGRSCVSFSPDTSCWPPYAESAGASRGSGSRDFPRWRHPRTSR
uniref:Putative secreted peptide n=1 Tax=Anopheles braziliensis TaxID=58242 RepID=A0A2M3ZNW4_9DIPT